MILYTRAFGCEVTRRFAKHGLTLIVLLVILQKANARGEAKVEKHTITGTEKGE